MADKDWPRKVGAGWNTSDGYRFRSEERARAHQERTKNKPARFGANAPDPTKEGDE